MNYIDMYSGFECFINICLGLAFLYAGTFMNFSLRKYVPVFYKSFRKQLWIACYLLSVPLFFRAIIMAASTLSGPFKSWYYNPYNYWFTTNLVQLLTTYMLIFSQVSSLVFGYLKRQQNQRKENLHDSPDSDN